MSATMTTTITETIRSAPRTTTMLSHRPQLLSQPAKPELAPSVQLSSYPFTPSPYGPPTLMTLPLELRLQIYSHLLTYEELTPADDPPAGYVPRVHPAILSACRQSHDEATALLYTLNTFTAHDSMLSGFPRLRPGYGGFVTSRAMAALVRRHALRLRLDVKPRFTAADAARAFSGAESLDLTVWQAQFRCAGHEVLALFEDVRGVGRVTITGSTAGFDEYARWLERRMTLPVGEGLGETYEGEMGDVSTVDVLC